MTLPAFVARLADVRFRIGKALREVGRNPDEVGILAAVKGRTDEELQTALAAGLVHLGESYVSEAIVRKPLPLLPEPVRCFIGPIQSNKTAAIATHFDWVLSVDRLKVAQRLNMQRPEGMPALSVCVQINWDREQQKSGVFPERALALCERIILCRRLQLRGLMAIPRMRRDAADRRECFECLAGFFRELKDHLGSVRFDTLSMGMSRDYEEAVRAGATMVRLGTALFGPRPVRLRSVAR